MTSPRAFITPETAAELDRLRAEYVTATNRAAAALMANGRPLHGALLDRFIEEEAKVTQIVRQIRDING